MKLLACGGREYANVQRVNHVLDTLHERFDITCLVEGGALGADRLARQWANAHNIPVETYEAEWKVYGKGAGVIRNGRMLAYSKPDIVVAFPGGTGTANMVKIARDAKVPTREVADA